ncbi:MAG: TlpA family protein disulfide reductase [Zoogloeaceae bacterium]|nr:TlpA family protein disulfide reductase [Zoogloeaceae bacterium]
MLTLASLPAISAPGTSPAAPEPHIVPATETGALRQLLSLKLADANNRTVNLEQWRGRILVINFWATWCDPCKEEMPAFSRLQEQFRGQGVQFVGIAVDSAENVRTFSKKYPVSYPLPLGDDRLLTLSRQLGNAYMSLPFTLLIDKQGQISTRKRGRFAEQDLARQIQEALQTRAVKK